MVACLATALLVGCDKPFPYYGTWRGYRDIKGQPDADPDILRQIGKVEVTVKATERFDIAINGLAASGAARHDGRNLVLEPQEVLGQPMERQSDNIKKAIPTATLKPNEDGTVTFLAPDQPPLVLERIATGTNIRP